LYKYELFLKIEKLKIAVIADIHEDIISLKKALKMIELEKCDHIVCLGDILGYPFMRATYEDTKNASECINLIRNNCSTVLLGNHDMFHLKKIPKFSSGFKFPDNWYNLSPEEKMEVSQGKVWNYSDDHPLILSDNDAEYLRSLPEIAIKDYGDRKVLFSHFLYPNFSAYVSTFNGAGINLRDHFRYQKQNGYELSICGHMHMEGMGISYDPEESIISKLFKGFMYYSYGEKKLKNKYCCLTIPAIGDNNQVNGFAILNSLDFSINVLSLNTNRRFIL